MILDIINKKRLGLELSYDEIDEAFNGFLKGDIENYQMKTTCLWLKNLPKLRTNGLPKPEPTKVYMNSSGKIKRRYFEENHGVIEGKKHGGNDAKARSKTFAGIANAMAEQWGAIET